MKKFKEFINENIKDLLKPKSEEEIEKELSNLDLDELLTNIRRYHLDDSYYPSDEEIIDHLNTLDTYNKLYFILDHNLGRKFLPADVELEEYLSTLATLTKLTVILDHKLGEQFLPPDDDIKEYLSTLNTMTWVKEVKKYGLNDKFLPTTRQIKKAVFDEYNMMKFKQQNNYKATLIPSEDKSSIELKSYKTIVAKYNFRTKKLKVYGYYSKTTNIHINSFIKYLGSNKKLSIQEISDEPKFKL